MYTIKPIEPFLYIQWKTITYHDIRENAYYISNKGDIYSIKYNRYLTPTLNTSSRYYVYRLIKKDGTNRLYQRHRLVAHAFCNPPDNYLEMQVNHINNIRGDDRYTNLEWVTAQENRLHAKEIGVLKIGENANTARFTEAQVRKICDLIEKYKYITHAQILHNLGMVSNKKNTNIITAIKRGDTWNDISKDYEFRKNYDSTTSCKSRVRPKCEIPPPFSYKYGGNDIV